MRILSHTVGLRRYLKFCGIFNFKNSNKLFDSGMNVITTLTSYTINHVEKELFIFIKGTLG